MKIQRLFVNTEIAEFQNVQGEIKIYTNITASSYRRLSSLIRTMTLKNKAITIPLTMSIGWQSWIEHES